MGIAKSFQITNVFPLLTTSENVRVGLQAFVSRYDIWRPRAQLPGLVEQADELLALVGLWDRARTAGEGIRAWGAARARNRHGTGRKSAALLLDEPTAGMSPEETRVMMDLIVKLAAERTIVPGRAQDEAGDGHQRPHPGAASRRTTGAGHARGGAPERCGQTGLSRSAGAS